ncbi:zinc finger protein ZFPM1 [Pleurodeles waltl]|uniref:zinc finger protein ZFPM1 n=1 Tax=Pleurodeles waltl TaxID=8319 RepID=UPI003709568C
MSRRKQSNPRQIKRSLGDMEDGEEKVTEDNSLCEKDGTCSDVEGSAEEESSCPSGSEDSESNEGTDSPKPLENDEIANGDQEKEEWNGPDDLELITLEGESKVRARWDLSKGLSWGPYKGNFQTTPGSPGPLEMGPPVTLVLEDKQCWLAKLPLVSSELEANSVIYRKGEEIWCRTITAISENDLISTFLVAEPQAIPNYGVKLEPEELPYPAALHSGIQLLPQQAGMAAILATAVVNKDVFPCKDCGIWYRSERNLQAHLMYYCASRQNPTSPSVEEKPKETYTYERVCPFPQCKKSCPSASSLEIHMRSHSGERPFVCSICHSAFTTKANCERHLKVHADHLNGICHGCGFTSATRDILYSHLVTSHMICQPGAKGEVYSPGPGIPVVKPLAQGLTTVNSSSAIKCTLCGFVADGLASLQRHALVHMHPCALPGTNQSPGNIPTPAVSPSSSDLALKKQQQDHLENGEAETPADTPCSSINETVLEVRIKEEPVENLCGETDSTCAHLGQDASRLDADPSSQDSSHPSREIVKVKTEVVSPKPGSSPVPTPAQKEMSILPAGGTVFMPQYVFGHEATVVPQASEILAKMSELVHSRLKQGHGGVPTLYAGAPIQKGATCFECEITFNNINNYYVHKRLYCSGRHLPDDSPPSIRKLKATTAKITTTPAPLKISQTTTAVAPVDSSTPVDIKVEASSPAVENKISVVKSEDVTMKDTSSEGDSTSRMSDDSQSPSSSVDDQEEDPTRTVCEACNIRFSRHETYMVHKRYYCASRHDPPSRRASAGRTPFIPQVVRTRKRRKLYEIHAAANPVPLPTLQLSEVSPPQSTLAQVANLGVSGSADSLAGVSSSDALPRIPGLITVTKSAAIPSPSSSPDTDGPIDLSKKPRLQAEVMPTAPVVPLTDYHACTACRISFSSLESYLEHKKYYCPATAIQQQLPKIQGPRQLGVSKHGTVNVIESMDVRGEERGKVKVERQSSLSPGAVAVSAKSLSLTTAYACVADMDSVPRYGGSAKVVPNPASPQAAICPFCPLSGPIRGDLIDHFKHVHGLLVAKPAQGHAIQVNLMDEMVATRTQVSSTAENNQLGPAGRAATSPQQLGSLPRGDMPNGKETTPVSSSAGSPLQNSTPTSLLPTSPTLPLNSLPVPEAPVPPMHTDKSVQTPKGLLTPLPNGNHRYCRLCNIRFSSLSTFIAHKKYYCSSHAAEHVK